MTDRLVPLLQVVNGTAAAVGALFFLRFWRAMDDPLFGLFSAALWLLSASWLLLASLNPVADAQPYIYGIRLVAFLLIIVAIVQKNREQG
jgi:hypothetical protein